MALQITFPADYHVCVFLIYALAMIDVSILIVSSTVVQPQPVIAMGKCKVGLYFNQLLSRG